MRFRRSEGLVRRTSSVGLFALPVSGMERSEQLEQQSALDGKQVDHIDRSRSDDACHAGTLLPGAIRGGWRAAVVLGDSGEHLQGPAAVALAHPGLSA
jgi:hypothetical protein